MPEFWALLLPTTTRHRISSAAVQPGIQWKFHLIGLMHWASYWLILIGRMKDVGFESSEKKWEDHGMEEKYKNQGRKLRIKKQHEVVHFNKGRSLNE
ncbi:Zinc finger protein 564 [Manis javanica]|nr:Zinc finger protein 564 [Manis javanica]